MIAVPPNCHIGILGEQCDTGHSAILAELFSAVSVNIINAGGSDDNTGSAIKHLDRAVLAYIRI